MAGIASPSAPQAGDPEPERAGLELMFSTVVYGFAASESGGRFAGLNVDSLFEYGMAHVVTLIENLAAKAADRARWAPVPGPRRECL